MFNLAAEKKKQVSRRARRKEVLARLGRNQLSGKKPISDQCELLDTIDRLLAELERRTRGEETQV